MIALGDFAGQWQVARDIEDRKHDQTGRFEGVAMFTAVPSGLQYEERGTLRLGAGPDMQATRRYHWSAEGDRIVVRFEDGRAFHNFLPGQANEAAHWCDPDQYDVAYQFEDWPTWTARWTVRGPNKDYGMSSLYTRPN